MLKALTTPSWRVQYYFATQYQCFICNSVDTGTLLDWCDGLGKSQNNYPNTSYYKTLYLFTILQNSSWIRNPKMWEMCSPMGDQIKHCILRTHIWLTRLPFHTIQFSFLFLRWPIISFTGLSAVETNFALCIALGKTSTFYANGQSMQEVFGHCLL